MYISSSVLDPFSTTLDQSSDLSLALCPDSFGLSSPMNSAVHYQSSIMAFIKMMHIWGHKFKGIQNWVKKMLKINELHQSFKLVVKKKLASTPSIISLCKDLFIQLHMNFYHRISPIMPKVAISYNTADTDLCQFIFFTILICMKNKSFFPP